MEKRTAVRFLLKGLKIDQRTKEYIEKRLAVLEKVLKNILHIAVEIDLDKKGHFRVEVMVKTPREMFRAEEITESVEGSIDIVQKELLTQIKKKHVRRRELKERGARTLKKKIVVDPQARF